MSSPGERGRLRVPVKHALAYYGGLYYRLSMDVGETFCWTVPDYTESSHTRQRIDADVFTW
jgi:hypothetical protein